MGLDDVPGGSLAEGVTVEQSNSEPYIIVEGITAAVALFAIIQATIDSTVGSPRHSSGCHKSHNLPVDYFCFTVFGDVVKVFNGRSNFGCHRDTAKF